MTTARLPISRALRSQVIPRISSRISTGSRRVPETRATHSAQLFLDVADNVTDARLWAAARIAFAYAALRFTEAYGLWKARTWAEWVALVSGTLLLPVEIRELMRGITWLRSALLIGNLAVVIYMIYVIRDNRRERRAAALGAAG